MHPSYSNLLPHEQVRSFLTRHKGKEIAKPITPQSESVSEEDNSQFKAVGNQRCSTSRLSKLIARRPDEETLYEQGIEAPYVYMAKIQEGLTCGNQVLLDSIGTVEQQNGFFKAIKESKKRKSLTQELKECKTNLDETVGLWGRTSKSGYYPKKAQSDKPRLYEIPYDTSDPANRFAPDGEEIVTLAKESRSKLDKDTVKPYNYTYQNSLYETFKPPSKAYLDQLERAKEVRKTMWRKSFC
ncbi:hypothetical protein Tco_0981234 [Tanacetum coccineum]